MGVIQYPISIPATVGSLPNLKFFISSDNLSTVTTAGYLNSSNIDSANPLSNSDVLMGLYGFNNTTQAGTFGIFTVSITASNGQITLTSWSNPGDAVLPTTANYLAHFTNTTGTISSAAANVTNPGNISAGLSGTAGTVSSFPSTSSKGSLALAAVANTGNTVTTISNAAMGQASTISIPDPGAATANFLLSAVSAGPQTIAGGLTISTGDLIDSAGNIAASQGNITAGSSGHAGTLGSFPGTAANGELILAAVNAGGAFNTTISNSTMGQSSVVSIPDPGAATANFVLRPSALVNGNFVKASGTAGLIVDGGAAIHAGTTGTYAGGGTSNAFSVTGMTASWIVTASNLTTTNSVSITKVVPGSNTLTITWSADPGANTTVNWTAVTAAI